MFEKLSKYLYVGIIGLAIIQLSAFTVWGYSALAIILPWSIGYACLLFVVTGLALLTAKKDDRWAIAYALLMAFFLMLSFVGGYLHPSDELREAINAR